MRKRTGRPQRFAAIPNDTIDDAANLDLTALGLLAVLIRHRDGWDVTLAEIGARYGYGEDALARAMGLLQVARYVVKIRIMSTQGNRWSTDVVVYDTPATDAEIDALLSEISEEDGVRNVQLIQPTKTALTSAAKRREKLSPDSGFSRSRGDLGKRGVSAGRPDSGVSRDSGDPRVSKKTVSKKTKKTSSSSLLTDARQSQPSHDQEEEEAATPKSETQERDDGEHQAAAAGLVAELPALARLGGRPLGRDLLPGEVDRLTKAITGHLAAGWPVERLRAVLGSDLGSAWGVVGAWHHRLGDLGAPPAATAAAASSAREPCGQCNSGWLEDHAGNLTGPCPACRPSMIGAAR